MLTPKPIRRQQRRPSHQRTPKKLFPATNFSALTNNLRKKKVLCETTSAGRKTLLQHGENYPVASSFPIAPKFKMQGQATQFMPLKKVYPRKELISYKVFHIPRPGHGSPKYKLRNGQSQWQYGLLEPHNTTLRLTGVQRLESRKGSKRVVKSPLEASNSSMRPRTFSGGSALSQFSKVSKSPSLSSKHQKSKSLAEIKEGDTLEFHLTRLYAIKGHAKEHRFSLIFFDGEDAMSEKMPGFVEVAFRTDHKNTAVQWLITIFGVLEQISGYCSSMSETHLKNKQQGVDYSKEEGVQQTAKANAFARIAIDVSAIVHGIGSKVTLAKMKHHVALLKIFGDPKEEAPFWLKCIAHHEESQNLGLGRGSGRMPMIEVAREAFLATLEG